MQLEAGGGQALCAQAAALTELHTYTSCCFVAVRAEQGEEGVRDLAEGLALLRQQGGRYAAYWRCPCCDTRLLSAEAFVQHLQVRI